MSVKDTFETQVPVPVEVCYETLRSIASDLGWRILEENEKSFTLKWQQTGFMSPGVKVTAILRQLPSRNTSVSMQAVLPGIALVDSFGYIPKAFGQIIEPFNRFVTSQHMVQEGLLCPTCGKQLSPGLRFCPNDGTPISIECTKCGSINTPSSQFCTACGAKLSAH